MYLKKYNSGFDIIIENDFNLYSNNPAYLSVSSKDILNLSDGKLMWQNGELVPNPDYETIKNQFQQEQQSKKQISLYKKELRKIQQWFKDNDWKVNKIVIGEWEKSDSRWLDYILERTVKRARQDELHSLIEELEIFEK